MSLKFDKVFITAANRAATLYTYGDIIPKEWLLEQFELVSPEIGTRKDFDRFAFEYMQNVEGFKSIMLSEYKMMLESLRTVGYRIVHPNEQTGIAMDRLKVSMSKEINKAIVGLTHINEDLLSLDEIRKRDDAHGKIAALAAFSKKRITAT